MNDLLNKYETREAVLLMFVADELSPDENARVTELLATQPALRAELDQLQGLDASFVSMIAGDVSIPAPGEDAAIRNVMRELRRRQLQPAAATPSKRLPYWAYPVSAAAAVLLGFLAWWGNQPAHVDPGAGPLAKVVAPVDTTPNPTELAKAADQLPASLADLDAPSDGPLASVVDKQFNDLNADNNDFAFPAP